LDVIQQLREFVSEIYVHSNCSEAVSLKKRERRKLPAIGITQKSRVRLRSTASEAG
jgi:hypothetical protein